MSNGTESTTPPRDLTNDALQYGDLPDVSQGMAFGLYAIYPSDNRFDTFLLGTIDRVNSPVEGWLMTFKARLDVHASPFNVEDSILDAPFDELIPVDNLDLMVEFETSSENVTDARGGTIEQLEDILTYSYSKPPAWLIRRNDSGKIELFTTTPVEYHSPTGTTQEYYTVDSHGLVVNFVAGELVTPAQVPPDWAKEDPPSGGEK